MKLSNHILQIKGYVPLGGNVPDGYMDQWIEQAKELEAENERLRFASKQALMAIEEGYFAPKITEDLRIALDE